LDSPKAIVEANYSTMKSRLHNVCKQHKLSYLLPCFHWPD